MCERETNFPYSKIVTSGARTSSRMDAGRLSKALCLTDGQIALHLAQWLVLHLAVTDGSITGA